jgi:hypothetical protein
MAVCSMSIALGSDASVFDLDGPLPEIPESNASKSGRERVIERARRQSDGPPIGPDRRQLRRPRPGRHAGDVRRPDWRSGSTAPPATASTSFSHGSRAASTISSTGSSPNRSVATSSAANTKAGPCAKTSAYRGPRTGSSRSGASDPEHRLGRLNYLCLPLRAESHLISIPLGSDICAVRVGWRADLALLRVGGGLRAREPSLVRPWGRRVRPISAASDHVPAVAEGLRTGRFASNCSQRGTLPLETEQCRQNQL